MSPFCPTIAWRGQSRGFGIDRANRADDSLDNLKLYTAAHQKLSRRTKDRRGILR
jgi:hypothetical protein